MPLLMAGHSSRVIASYNAIFSPGHAKGGDLIDRATHGGRLSSR